VLSAVLTVFAPILWGAAARFFLDDAAHVEKVCGDLAFRFFAPPLVFMAISGGPQSLLIDVAALCALGGSTAFTGLILFVGLRLSGSRKVEAVAIGVVGAYGNTVFFGLPLAAAVLGEAALAPSAVIAVFTYVTTMVGSTLALASVEGGRMGQAARLLHVVRRAATTPVLIAVGLAVLFNAAGVKLPQAVSTGLMAIGALAAPLALFGVGIAIARLAGAWGKAKAPIRPVAIAQLAALTMAKLALAPTLVWLAFAMVQPEDGVWWAAALLAAATPTAIVAHLLARYYAPECETARMAIVITTLGAVFTAPLWAGVARAMISG
jgi:malonate transporter and related proteins